MNQLDSASGKAGGCQPSDNGKQFSVTLDQPDVGTFRTVKTCKLAFHVSLDGPRPARRLVGRHDRASAPLGCAARRDDTFSRCEAALPCAGMSGPMDPNPVARTVFPNEGYRYENS